MEPVEVAATRQLAVRALAPLALMGLIYFLSAQPDLNSGLGTLDLILRKLAHATEYALLTLLWAWALRPVTRWNVALAAAIAVLYAASDEFHQTFVEGRHGAASDILVDAAGVADRDRPAPLPSVAPHDRRFEGYRHEQRSRRGR